MRKYFENPAVSRALDGAGDSSVRGSSLVAPRLSLGGVEISPATVLAPMAGVTDTVFRRFIRNLAGCGLIMTEFTSADGVLRAKDRQEPRRYLHFYEDEHPISAQLFGSRSAGYGRSCAYGRGLGFDMVDMNFGCPAKKVVKCNGGSGLLRDLPLIGKDLRGGARCGQDSVHRENSAPDGMTRRLVC